MPLLNVKVIENVFTDEQKKQMVEKLTEAMVSIEGENMRGVTWVIVEEVKSGDWGIGGNALTTADVNADPSLNLMPGRRVIVQVSKVALLVMDWARYGLMVPSAATAIKGS